MSNTNQPNCRMCDNNGRHIIASEYSTEKMKPYDTNLCADVNHNGSDAKGVYTLEVTDPRLLTTSDIRKKAKEYLISHVFSAYQLGLDDNKRKVFFDEIELTDNKFKLKVKYGSENTWEETNFRVETIKIIKEKFSDVTIEDEEKIINKHVNASLYYN